MDKRFIFAMVAPLGLATSLVSSCNKTPTIITKMKDTWVNPQYRATAPDITATEFNKTFSHGDIIKMTITDKTGKDNTVVLPYVTEYAEAGYYGACLCDESDGSHAGKPEKDYVNLSLAMHPFSNRAEEFFSCPVKFTMYSKAGFKAKMEAANCTEKLTLEQLGGDILAYANFRDVSKIGNFKNVIKSNVMYRGASPINSGTTGSDRFDYANNLLQIYDVDIDICLNTTYIQTKDGKITGGCAKDIDGFLDKEASPIKPKKNEYICNKFKGKNAGDWSQIATYKEEESNMCCVPLSTDFYSTTGNNPLKMCGKVFASIGDSEIKGEGMKSFYIHCEEGKDRTGFICAALEALATPSGAESNDYLEDIVADFMLSYKNYFNITLSQDINRYQEIADLTIYRHLYGICLEKPEEEFTKEDFNWLAHDTTTEVRKLLTNEENHNLNFYATRYVKKALKEYYKDKFEEETELNAKVDEVVTGIKTKICDRD